MFRRIMPQEILCFNLTYENLTMIILLFIFTITYC